MASEKVQNTSVPNVSKFLMAKRERERERKTSLTLGLKTIYFLLLKYIFKGGQWNKINFFVFPQKHRTLSKPPLNLSRVQYHFLFFPFSLNESC